MNKYLKLVGLATYAGKAVRGSVIAKGDICLFAAEVADRLLEGHNSGPDGEARPYWKEVPEDSAKTFMDFSDIKLDAVTSVSRKVTRADVEEDAGEEAEVKPAIRARAKRSVGQRAAARA